MSHIKLRIGHNNGPEPGKKTFGLLDSATALDITLLGTRCSMPDLPVSAMLDARMLGENDSFVIIFSGLHDFGVGFNVPISLLHA